MMILKFLINTASILLAVTSVFNSTSDNQSKSNVEISAININAEFEYKPYALINIDYHGSKNKYIVHTDTADNVLKALNIELSNNDVIDCELNKIITGGQTITIDEMTYDYTYKTETIPFKTEIIEDDTMLKSDKEVIQKGVNGSEKFKIKNVYRNNEFCYYEKSIINKNWSQNEVVRVGTKDIIELNDNDNQNSVLLKTNYDDDSFSLNEVKLSDDDRELLERLVTGEFGNSYIGSCLIAQAIKCAIVYDGYSDIESLIKGMGYVGSTNISKSQNAINAVKYIFDENGLAVKHRIFYMCTEDYFNDNPNNFHSTQNFILQYQNVKFFDRW